MFNELNLKENQKEMNYLHVLLPEKLNYLKI